MKPTVDHILSTHAVVTKTPSGWLAVSQLGSPIRVGIMGATRTEAEQNFAAEIRAWATLAEKPDQPPWGIPAPEAR